MYYSSDCQVLYVRREVAICALEASAADSANTHTHTPHISQEQQQPRCRSQRSGFLGGLFAASLSLSTSLVGPWALRMSILRVLCNARVGTLGWGSPKSQASAHLHTDVRIQELSDAWAESEWDGK